MFTYIKLYNYEWYSDTQLFSRLVKTDRSDIVNFLLADPRVDPSVDDNHILET